MPAPTRRLLACATVLLALLQAVALLGSAKARAAGAFGFGVAAGERCLTARDGVADEAPATHHTGEHHCVLCASREAPAPAMGAEAPLVSPSPFAAAAATATPALSPRPPPLGWASSWSSRAPPLS